MSTTKKLSDAEILDHLIFALKTNKKQLANDLGYKSHQSIYFVANGRNRLSEDMINRFILKFPEINAEFLRSGNGDPLKYKTERQSEKYNHKKPTVSLEDLMNLPERLLKIEELLEKILKKLK